MKDSLKIILLLAMVVMLPQSVESRNRSRDTSQCDGLTGRKLSKCLANDRQADARDSRTGSGSNGSAQCEGLSSRNRKKCLAAARQETSDESSSSRGPKVVELSAPNLPVGISVLDRRPDARECVDYARSRMPTLPYGLFTFKNKTDMINSKTARVGSVAIINVPTGEYSEYGHVAYVEEVTANSITISETHYSGRNYTLRRSVGRSLANAEAQLHIVGYRRP